MEERIIAITNPHTNKDGCTGKFIRKWLTDNGYDIEQLSFSGPDVGDDWKAFRGRVTEHVQGASCKFIAMVIKNGDLPLETFEYMRGLATSSKMQFIAIDDETEEKADEDVETAET